MTQINLILPTYVAFAIKNDSLNDLDYEDLSRFNVWWADQEKRHGLLLFCGCCNYHGDAESDDYTGDPTWDHQLVTFEVIDSAEAQKK